MDVEATSRKFEAVPTHSANPTGIGLDSMYARVFFGLGTYFDLTPTESLLLALIHSLSRNGRAWCYMSQQQMAGALNVSLTTVNALLEKMHTEEELIERGVKRHPQWSTIQWRLSPKAMDRLSYIEAQIKKNTKSRSSRI